MEWLIIIWMVLIAVLIFWVGGHLIDSVVNGHMAELRQEADARYRIPVKRLSEGAGFPRYMTTGSAAADLVAADDVEISAGMRALVKTGIAGAIPEGCMGFVCSRSGLALKHGIIVANAPGVIDSDYRGEWGVILLNLSREMFTIKSGDRVAQLMILPVEQYDFEETEKLDDTNRGSGGFGHTGA